MKAKPKPDGVGLGWSKGEKVHLPSRRRPTVGVATVSTWLVARCSANERRHVPRLAAAMDLAERLRELALEAELEVNKLTLSGQASNTDGLAELRGTCLELARTALLTLLSAAHEQASLPEPPAREEQT